MPGFAGTCDRCRVYFNSALQQQDGAWLCGLCRRHHQEEKRQQEREAAYEAHAAPIREQYAKAARDDWNAGTLHSVFDIVTQGQARFWPDARDDREVAIRAYVAALELEQRDFDLDLMLLGAIHLVLKAGWISLNKRWEE